MSVAVLGSINMDLVVRTRALPLPGETLTGDTFFTAPGGKGANQAVACARMEVPTQLIGRVGNDWFGSTLREQLMADGVDVSAVVRDANEATGIAVIAVNAQAENSIIVTPGANGRIGDLELEQLASVLHDVHVLLLQLEVPIPAVVQAARLAKQHGVTVILDPAPAITLPSELYSLVDILTPNMTEASALVGFPVQNDLGVVRAAQVLLDRGARNVVVKMGGEGAYWNNGKEGNFFEAFPVQAVDSVAAGDAFNGALAAALYHQIDLRQALEWALAAGAWAVTKAGAQPSLPRRKDVVAMLAQRVSRWAPTTS